MKIISPYKLKLTEWSDGSIPGMMYTGGMCGNMSKIGRGTYISLGQPAIQAGQPKHACLITYSQSDGKYSAIIKEIIFHKPKNIGAVIV